MGIHPKYAALFNLPYTTLDRISRHLCWLLNTELHVVASDSYNGDDNVITDENALAYTSGNYPHCLLSLRV